MMLLLLERFSIIFLYLFDVFIRADFLQAYVLENEAPRYPIFNEIICLN